MSLDGENHRHGALRCSCDYRNWRRDTESTYAVRDCSVGFRRISSDIDRYSYRVALGACRREPLPRWVVFVLRTDEISKRAGWVLLGFSHTGNTLHHQLFISPLRHKMFQRLTPNAGRLNA